MTVKENRGKKRIIRINRKVCCCGSNRAQNENDIVLNIKTMSF